MLWFGWFGFNAGSSLAANGLAVSALVVTNLAAAAAALSWMAVDWIKKGKPSAIGFCIGAVCGLVAITPASGFVGPMSSIIIGFVAGIISNFISSFRVTRTRIDDTLDVFACHGVSGIWGALATGLFANAAINKVNGLFFGNPGQFTVQLIAVGATALYTAAVTYIIYKVVDAMVGVRVKEKEEIMGLDLTQHREGAYTVLE